MHETRLLRLLFLAIWTGVLLFAASGCLPAGESFRQLLVYRAEPDPASELKGVSFVRQVVARDNRSARTIMWQTEKPLNNPVVEWRRQGDTKVSVVPAAAELFEDDAVKRILYTAGLEALPAGEKLEYRIADRKEKGVWHTLHTDNGSEFKALIFPDSQSSDYTDWKNIAGAAAKANPDAAFFVNMGDLVDNGEDSSQWRAWFDGVSGIIDRIPIAPVMGNHETYNRQWKVREPLAYLRKFPVPDNGSSHFARYYYSFDYGPVHFIVLNTQQHEIDEFRPGITKEQQAWFQADAASSDKPWQVVLMHRDTLQYRIHKRPERREGFSDEGVLWMPLFDRFNIDAVFSAHLHTYRNRGHIKAFEEDKRGPLYILTGVAGNVRYPGLWVDHAFDKVVAPQPETGNYLTLEASEDKLVIRCYLPNGIEIDNITVRKT